MSLPYYPDSRSRLRSPPQPHRLRSIPIYERGRALIDVAVMLAGGGESNSDISVLRHQSGTLGPVASDPKVWRKNEPDPALDSITGPPTGSPSRHARMPSDGNGPAGYPTEAVTPARESLGLLVYDNGVRRSCPAELLPG